MIQGKADEEIIAMFPKLPEGWEWGFDEPDGSPEAIFKFEGIPVLSVHEAAACFGYVGAPTFTTRSGRVSEAIDRGLDYKKTFAPPIEVIVAVDKALRLFYEVDDGEE